MRICRLLKRARRTKRRNIRGGQFLCDSTHRREVSRGGKGEWRRCLNFVRRLRGRGNSTKTGRARWIRANQRREKRGIYFPPVRCSATHSSKSSSLFPSFRYFFIGDSIPRVPPSPVLRCYARARANTYTSRRKKVDLARAREGTPR